MDDPVVPVNELLASKDVQLLAEIGFIALSYGFYDHARDIFDGLATIRPKQEGCVIGRSLVCIVLGEVDKAVSLLRSVPISDLVCLFLGIALVKQGKLQSAREYLELVVQSHQADKAFVLLARDLLDGLSA